MNLTREQSIMLRKIWIVLKDKLVEFAGTTRERNVDVVDALNTIAANTLKLHSNYTEEESKIAIQFVELVINTIITTKSLTKTIEKVETVYNF